MVNERALKVGVISLASSSWSAGASYSRMVAMSLAKVAARFDLDLSMLASADSQPPEGVRLLSVQAANVSLRGKLLRHSLRWRERLPVAPAERRMRRVLRWIDRSDPLHVAREAGLDVVLPFIGDEIPRDVHTVGWIPDLQHRGLPDLFSPEERAMRDRVYGRTACNSDRLIVSSEAVLEHCRRELPGFRAGTTHVAHFPSLFAFGMPAVPDVVTHYHLPRKFVLIANQFWTHKNHALALRAWSRLGDPPHLVMVGRPVDYRDPSNKLLSTLLQEIASNGLREHTSLLGEVPYAHLIALLRSAALVLQPSRFEGWSTTVQDARALGRPVACSAIATHREQAPDALFFFEPDDADALAAGIRENWPRLSAGPDPSGEANALAREAALAQAFGELVARVCYLAAGRTSPC